mmetsp:Transcript_58961/g.164768  ORF Transcript_58961/g.164768 Transcript_58961/m.164768 type:complete len:436 (+) Transcript_58961:107-1414(+)
MMPGFHRCQHPMWCFRSSQLFALLALRISALLVGQSRTEGQWRRRFGPAAFMELETSRRHWLERPRKDRVRLTANWDFTGQVSMGRTHSLDQHGRSDVMKRTYHVLLPKVSSGVPENAKPKNGKWPAILMFHGYGSDATAVASEGSMAKVGPSQGYMVVYVEGFPDPKSHVQSKERVWNSGSCGGPAANKHIDDVGFVSAVVDDIVKKHDADSQRIFVAGISNGGSMALRAFCERADLFASAAIIHGSLEMRDGLKCAETCSNGPCDWSATGDCSEDAWADKLPVLFECTRPGELNKPVIFFNGMQNEWISGGVYPHFGGSYPPLDFMVKYFYKTYGCNLSETMQSFRNGTGTDVTTCSTSLCGSNITVCRSNAGDWWYGEPYDIKTPCLYKGYSEFECEPTRQFRYYGASTSSVHLTGTILEFFHRALADKAVL